MQTTIPTVRTTSSQTDYNFLRRVMTTDTLFCAVSGIFLVIFAQPVTAFLGAGTSVEMVGLGLFLMLTALFIYMTLRGTSLQQTRVKFLIGANALWVVASVALVIVASAELTTGAKVTILAQALLTADVAFFEWLGLRRGH